MISASDVGRGVAAQPATPAPASAAAPQRHGDVEEWLDVPEVEDQVTKHPGTIRAGGVITEVFVLNDPADLKRLNDLRARERTSNPTIAVVNVQRQFDEAHSAWVVLLEYRQLQFKRILPKTSQT